MSFDEHKTRIIEEGEDYVVNDVPYSIMENSCRYFGSSLEGRLLGSKDMLGSIYKAPIIVEETRNMIFFPTEAINSSSVSWISYKKIRNVEKYGRKTKIVFNNGETVVVDCPYFSIKNQIFRCNMLDTISRNRKG